MFQAYVQAVIKSAKFALLHDSGQEKARSRELASCRMLLQGILKSVKFHSDGSRGGFE